MEIRKMAQPIELEFPLPKVKEAIRPWLFLEDEGIIDVMCATVIANQFKTDPLWIIFIGPPSHAKTELLRALDGHPNAYFLSNLTPATMVSGKPRKGPDPSLLPKLNDKILVMKDFTTVLTMRSENQSEVLSQFREIYDGSYTKCFGTGKEFHWKGHVGLLAACTPVYDKHYSVIGSLGDRFMLYRIENTKEEDVGFMAQSIVGQEDRMRKEIREAVHRFLDQFKKVGNIQFGKDESINQKIVTLACFCAHARCPVDRDRYTQAVQYLPQAEGPARLVKQFMQLGMGLALVHGKNVIDVQIYDILKKVGRDLISAQRLSILKHLWEEKVFEYLKEWKSSKEVGDAINMPTSTAKLNLEDLMIVGLLNRLRSGDGETAPYKWQWGQRGYDMAAGANVFEVSKDEPF
jgi:hypothetical protein